MKEKIDLLGAIVAHVIFVSSIITFSSRMIFKLQPGHWIGIPILEQSPAYDFFGKICTLGKCWQLVPTIFRNLLMPHNNSLEPTRPGGY
jgi:hypothetical protein